MPFVEGGRLSQSADSSPRKKLPYYPYYTKLFAESEKVLAMNLAEFGLYQFALNHAWDFGSIPGDLRELARVLRQPYPAVKKSWPKVAPCWKENGHPGRLINERQEIERQKAIAKSDKAAQSVRTRYGSSTNVGTNEPTNAHIRASSISLLGYCSEGKGGLGENPLYARWDDFLTAWPEDRRGVDLGCQLWISLIDTGEITAATIADVFAGLERWKGSDQWRKGFIPAISNPEGKGWLQRRAWKDIPKKAEESW